jgi:glycerol-3-phosphate dehydrogenase
VRYAVKHEYAQTVVDVIARRTRLSFLNAQASLDALPRIVEIMGEELGWSRDRKEKEIEGAGQFLLSMGLQPGTPLPEVKPSNIVERVGGALHTGLGLRSSAKAPSTISPVAPAVSFSRAQFESGELENLKAAFARVAKEERLARDQITELVHLVPGYESIGPKETDYVLAEAGFVNRKDLDFDEFVEVNTILFLKKRRRVLTELCDRFVQS